MQETGATEAPGAATFAEIISQTASWTDALDVVDGSAQALDALWAAGDYRQVIFTGCGSTHYLALAAAATFQTLTGCPAHGVPAGELVMYPEAAYAAGERTLLVAVSRSAETTETLLVAREFRRRGSGAIITVTNYAEGRLADMGDINLVISAGRERSVAQTRSFASMYVAATALACRLARHSDLWSAMRDLAPAGRRLIEEYAPLAERLGRRRDIDRIYFLGSGPRYGLACEASLKMKEMSLSHSEPFHFLEFRHGPKAMVGDHTLVAGLLGDTQRTLEGGVMAELVGLGASTLAIGEQDADVVFRSGIPEVVRNVLCLPVLQLMAYHRALAWDLDPDHPTNLDAVVRLEEETQAGDD